MLEFKLLSGSSNSVAAWSQWAFSLTLTLSRWESRSLFSGM